MSRTSRFRAQLIGPSRLLAVLLAVALTPFVLPQHAAHAASHRHINCADDALVCTEVLDSRLVFNKVYIGHDEPSLLFYSNQPGSGNTMRYDLTLPKDPPPTTTGASYNFELHPAFWFGMAMCDTQSFPEQLSTCAPDSDSNIVDPAVSASHPGQAFMEMQFYPPGWAPWPAGVSCDPTQWCAALNIDSLSENPVTGQINNATCLGIAGLEYVNFAFVTHSGAPQPLSPPNPVNSTINTFTPNPSADLFMNSGDRLTVGFHDTAHGLRVDISDHTTHQTGSMTASASNGFGQVQFDPTGTSCNNIPYDFHPMYSTSSEATRVTWAAHSYNVSFSDEIGHFDYCNDSSVTFWGSCTSTEGQGSNIEPADGDDNYCFDKSVSLLVQVSGCTYSNTGFDGTSYLPDWPDGNTALHPTPIIFTSPKTGPGYSREYSRVAFEADLPRIEGTCNRNTGAGCTLIPITDDGAPAAFYPYYSTGGKGLGNCVWMLGGAIPGARNDFGQNAQYGTLLSLTYTALGGGSLSRYNDFRQVLDYNPCK